MFADEPAAGNAEWDRVVFKDNAGTGAVFMLRSLAFYPRPALASDAIASSPPRGSSDRGMESIVTARTMDELLFAAPGASPEGKTK